MRAGAGVPRPATDLDAPRGQAAPAPVEPQGSEFRPLAEMDRHLFLLQVVTSMRIPSGTAGDASSNVDVAVGRSGDTLTGPAAWRQREAASARGAGARSGRRGWAGPCPGWAGPGRPEAGPGGRLIRMPLRPPRRWRRCVRAWPRSRRRARSRLRSPGWQRAR